MAFPDCNCCDIERNSVVDFAWSWHCFEVVFPKTQKAGEKLPFSLDYELGPKPLRSHHE